MLLISDAGGTGAKWCLADTSGIIARFATSGINPVVLSEAEIARRIAEEVLPAVMKALAASGRSASAAVERIYYYGAGCRAGAFSAAVGAALAASFPSATISVASDMTGAAVALLGDEPGIACIIGTGSNSCLWDGSEIVDAIPSLGYILGDEGSGAALGRSLLNAIFKRTLPDDICREFRASYPFSLDEIIERVYRRPEANRFLASFTPFLAEHISRPDISSLVGECFWRFFANNICKYRCGGAPTVNFVGSIAFYFKEELAATAARLGFKIGKIIQSPLDDIAYYHIHKMQSL